MSTYRIYYRRNTGYGQAASAPYVMRVGGEKERDYYVKELHRQGYSVSVMRDKVGATRRVKGAVRQVRRYATSPTAKKAAHAVQNYAAGFERRRSPLSTLGTYGMGDSGLLGMGKAPAAKKKKEGYLWI